MDKNETLAWRKLQQFIEAIEHARKHFPEPERFPIEVTLTEPMIVNRIELFFSGVRGMFDLHLNMRHKIKYIDYVHREEDDGRVCIRLYPGDDTFKEVSSMFKSSIRQVGKDLIDTLMKEKEDGEQE